MEPLCISPGNMGYTCLKNCNTLAFFVRNVELVTIICIVQLLTLVIYVLFRDVAAALSRYEEYKFDRLHYVVNIKEIKKLNIYNPHKPYENIICQYSISSLGKSFPTCTLQTTAQDSPEIRCTVGWKVDFTRLIIYNQ